MISIMTMKMANADPFHGGGQYVVPLLLSEEPLASLLKSAHVLTKLSFRHKPHRPASVGPQQPAPLIQLSLQ